MKKKIRRVILSMLVGNTVTMCALLAGTVIFFERSQSASAHPLLLAVIYLLVLLLLSGGGMFYFASRYADRLAHPISLLTEKVQAIEGDHLELSWDLDTGDEVQVLAEAFASMTDRMKNYIDEIRRIEREKKGMEAEMSVATQIQASMLPSHFPAYPERSEFDLYARMDPAKEVGGDFYDFFFIDENRMLLVMADVSGKGVPAALFMVIAMNSIKYVAQSIDSVDLVCNITNNLLCSDNAEHMFVTAWIGILDVKTGALSWCDAGHEYPYIIKANGEVSELHPTKKRMPLAVMENMMYIASETVLDTDDCLFLYTDGLPEATAASEEMFGAERVKAVLEKYGTLDTKELLEKIREEVDGFVGDAPQFDDLTMLALRYKNREETEA